MMNLIERTKSILISPKEEWSKIGQENDTPVKLLTTYLLWLAILPAAAAFIGYGLIGFRIPLVGHIASLEWGIRMALLQYVSVIGGVFLTAFVFDMLASYFGAEKSFNKAFQLATYCYAAVCVGGIFYIYWSLSFLAGVAGLYALYILYCGLKPMMKVPEEKTINYFVAALITMVVVAVVLSVVLTAIMGVRPYMY